MSFWWSGCYNGCNQWKFGGVRVGAARPAKKSYTSHLSAPFFWPVNLFLFNFRCYGPSANSSMVFHTDPLYLASNILSWHIGPFSDGLVRFTSPDISPIGKTQYHELFFLDSGLPCCTSESLLSPLHSVHNSKSSHYL